MSTEAPSPPRSNPEATDPAAARDLLQQAAAICPARFIEAPAARLETEKLSR
ncbi:MAG TPA: hypothetical protein VHW66_02825 [Stellaceae bacterium]|jgi:hypothetical protein|nr:hypothetical protein [Stellaceae bacterium]